MSFETLPGEEHWQHDGEPIPVEISKAVQPSELNMYMYHDLEEKEADPWNLAVLKEIEGVILPYFIAWNQDRQLDQSHTNDLIVRLCATSRELERALSATPDRDIESLDFIELKKIAPAPVLFVTRALLARKHADI